MTHADLVVRGASWLRRNGFGVVATELTTAATREIPDVIGFRSDCSVVIEVKVSRADFLRDQRKPHRASGGLGLYRFFLSEPSVIASDELPTGWGLLHLVGRSIKRIVAPPGNVWPSERALRTWDAYEPWRAFQHERDIAVELSVLYSIARRAA